MLVAALDEGSMPERQAAVAALATTGSDAATAALSKQLVALEAGTLPNAMAVDVLAAGRSAPNSGRAPRPSGRHSRPRGPSVHGCSARKAAMRSAGAGS
jgi:hypothetical protein